MAFSYPSAHRGPTVDSYHGREVADPYRWLEDLDSEETKAFVAGQNAISRPYLDGLSHRQGLVERMAELWDTPRTDPPVRRGDVLVWTHNDGLADQPVFWIKRAESEAEVLLDPNTMSDDGAVAVVVSALSPDGRLLAYTVSDGGSDRQRLAIRSTQTGEDLEDRLDHLRFTSIAWWGDGFFYTRWPETEPGSTEPVRDPSVHSHRIGDDQGDDVLIFHNDDDPEPSYSPVVTEDERLLLLIEYVGTDRRNGLLYLNLQDFQPASAAPEWVRLVDVGQATHHPVHYQATDQAATGPPAAEGTNPPTESAEPGGTLILMTDRDAPNGKVVSVDLTRPEPDQWMTVVAEGSNPLEWATAVDGQLVAAHLVDASHTLSRVSLDGSTRHDLALPGLGTVTGLSGRSDQPDFYIGYQSFVVPPMVLQCRAGPTTVWASSEAQIDPSSVVVERRTATSSDGRSVGMFVVRMVDTALPGPVELYGYGGFSINLTPTYSPARLAFLEAGGVVVVANLRGGTEQGEQWHVEGMLGNKQQVFDDLAACAQQLIDDGIATPATIGIRGGSNGGLLTAATMLQRPELFGAVVSQVPVTDMLRFQHFTAGRFWTVEYGDAADPEAFEWLIDYSPIHNVSDGSTYPPLLITTAEFDDRVVPMHAHKLAAEIQYRAGGRSRAPLIERIETRAGHGLGKPTAKLIEESADIYAFLLHHLQPS